MNENKKAADDVEAIGSGTGDLMQEREESAHPDFIIGPGDGQGPISRLLMRGAENALTKQEIMRIAGITSIRQFRQMVESERKRGELILTTRGYGAGYFLPDDGEKGRDEIQRHIASYTAQAISMLRTAERERMALCVLPGQVPISDDK